MKKSIFLFFAAILCAMNVNAWSLMGEVTDWSTGKEMKGDSKVVSVTVNLQANKTLKLKIKNGSTWYGNGGTMTSANNLAWEFSTTAGDASIKTAEAGDYTFTWYISDKKLSVTYPNHNYIIAGEGDVLEDAWAPGSNKNKMTKQDDGTYSLTKTNRTLQAKTYGYKLTVGSWDVNQYPKDDAQLQVATAGNYDVVFTYNPKTGTLSHELIPVYTVSVSANPAVGGTATGGGSYTKGTNITVTATPNAGYEFVAWKEGENVLANTAEYSFDVTQNTTLVADFELSNPAIPTYVITVSANDAAMGTVTGGGEYTEGSTVTLTASANAGYRFVNWTVGGVEKETATTYSFTASEALTIVANFEVIPKYDITVKAVVPEAWTSATIGIHYWGDGISATENPVATEKEGNWNKYTIKEVPEGTSVNVIFINGANWSNNANQTANITGITEDKCFQISAKTLDGEGKCTFTEVDCAADIKPEGDVYTIMGAGELGLSWELTTTGNDMTKQTDGTYTLVKEGLDLATTGSYEYKVVKNHSWDWSIPTGTDNHTLKVDKDGTYTVTFTLSADKKTLTADALCTAEKEVILDCSVAGTINLVGGTADFTDKLAMTYDEGTKTYSKTFTALAAGNYQMKVVYGSDWLGYDKLTKPVPANVTEGDDKKIKFSLAEAGDVTVTYNVENGIGLVGTFAAPETKYYIAGTQNLTGFDWKENGLEMTKEGDVYKHTFSELPAGIYEFKITDGTWTNQWNYNNLGAAYDEVSQGVDDEGKPNGNIKIVTEEAKNITVIFDATEDKITLEGLTPYVAPLTYTVTVPAGTEKCYIAGAFAQSNWNTFLEMEQVTGEDKFTITITGAKESDEYKYACQADWAYAEVIDGGGNRTNWSELDEVTAWGKPVIVTYQLKGVGGWEQPGIELVQNPDPEKASEYMLTCQAISATDAIKVVRLEDGVITDYYGNGTVKDGVQVTVEYDDQANIKLPAGTYNFYFDTAEPEKKLWIAEATDCVTEPTTVTLNYDLTTDAVTNKMGRRYVTAEDATLGEVQIILPYFSAETTEYAEAFLIVGSETLDATATYAADAENNLEVYTATATSEDGATIYNVTMNVTVPATQEYTFLATNGAEYVTEDWGEEGEPFIVYMISGEGYLNDETVAFDMSVDQMGNLEATINDVYVMGTATNLVEEEGYLWLAGTANDEGGNTYNIEMNVAQAVEEVEIVITDEVNVTLGYLNLEVMGNMAMVTAGNEELPLSFWLTLLETENYYGSYGADMFSNIWYGDNQLQPYGDGTYNQNGLVVSFISEPDEAGNATKYNFTLKKDEIYSRAVTNQWGTICLPFGSNNYTGAEFYELVQAKADGVVLASVETLEAGVPYIFKATATELAVYSDGTTVTEAGNHNGLYGTFTDNTEVTEGNYILKDNAICEVAATCYVNKNRAYVVMSEVPTEPVQQMPGRRYIGLDVHGENGTTGLDNIMTTDAPVKAIENGQLIIIRGGEKYNVQGQKL